ncbi:hypothetical protein GCM10011390_32850 [Aureimonas endophytica]|uniref:Uncharacterized protein n=1 Tax=Aureimonas endophytica TaxID=2027858 RepID=A0A916ZT32_9HYPH|nr:hypothetical protein [Aureimonas endophytica]GGE11241.1 hypothetical protein GCM10011390_32850 [Aureimonas endophytica]
MGTTLTGRFETRREAEMTVERLVQEYGIERTDIFVAATGRDNTAGEAPAGSDRQGGDPGGGDRDDAALNGAIEVSVDLEDEALAGRVRSAFAEFEARGVEAS